MNTLVRAGVRWLPLAVAITLLCGLIYATVQQNYRQSLNDPQVQMAEDGAALLANDYTPAALVQRGVPPVDISKSLAPWIAVYDESGKVLESSAVFDGKPPIPPQGAFDVARAGQGKDTHIPGQNRVSWQPREGVRSAIVIQHVSGTRGGFVVAGRNMREVEQREANLSNTIMLGWIVTLVTTFLAAIFARIIY